MRKLMAGVFLISLLPMTVYAETQGGPQRPRTIAMPEEPANKQSEAYTICLRATALFDQQEKAKGNPKTEVTSLATACEEELKPASYWRCMDAKAQAQVDFNAAHYECAKQTHLRQ